MSKKKEIRIRDANRKIVDYINDQFLLYELIRSNWILVFDVEMDKNAVVINKGFRP